MTSWPSWSRPARALPWSPWKHRRRAAAVAAGDIRRRGQRLTYIQIRSSAMTGFSRSHFGFAIATSVGCLLALGASNAPGQDAVKTAAVRAAKAATAKTAAPVTNSSDIGLLDVPWKTLLQPTVKNDWIYYNGDYSGRRYSALSEINATNVSHLGAKWIFRVSGNPSSMEVTPVVVNGIMFVTAQNDVYALDAETG